MNPESALEALIARVVEVGDPMQVATSAPPHPPLFGLLAASGPRTAADPGGYAFVAEAVREGYLCHYGRSRVLEDPDSDLALLAGDLFYAIGIARLAELDDSESVRILSELIRVSADLWSDARGADAESLWLAQILALAFGSGSEQRGLVEALRRGEPTAPEALEAWTFECAGRGEVTRRIEELREVIDSRPIQF